MSKKTSTIGVLALVTMLTVLARPWIQAAPPGGSLADVRVNQDLVGLQQAETSVAVNPLDSRNVVVTYTDFSGPDRGTGSALGYGFTTDGGRTWQSRVISFPEAADMGDTSVVADGSGRFFLTVGLDLLSGGTAQYVLRSDDGGKTLAPPMNGGPFIDKVYIGVDPATNVLYLAGNATNPRGGGGIFMTKSTDGGATFSNPIPVSTAKTSGFGPVPVVGPNHEVYLAWTNFGGRYPNPTSTTYFNRSLDGGATWRSKDVLIGAVTLGPTSPDYVVNGGFPVFPIPATAVDVSSGPYRGRVYVLWADARFGSLDI